MLYEFKKDGTKAALKELGPRFTLRLKALQKGTFNPKFGQGMKWRQVEEERFSVLLHHINGIKAINQPFKAISQWFSNCSGLRPIFENGNFLRPTCLRCMFEKKFLFGLQNIVKSKYTLLDCWGGPHPTLEKHVSKNSVHDGIK
ncbi:Brix domain-containing protein F44G4.1, partial [Trichinella britovi]